MATRLGLHQARRTTPHRVAEGSVRLPSLPRLPRFTQPAQGQSDTSARPAPKQVRAGAGLTSESGAAPSYKVMGALELILLRVIVHNRFLPWPRGITLAAQP